MAAMDPLQAKANYSRICQLLIDKGGDALRAAFHVIHPPPSLAAVLNANKSALKKIRYSVINPSQWNLLFPVSGSPDSKNFDITLLTILLRNICGLTSPAAGWNAMPSAGDTSISADILRIKFFRNQVYGHIARAQLDDTTFETLWQEISKPLVKLGIRQQDIDEAKVASLSPEEESYIEKLKQWKELEDDILPKLNYIEREVIVVRDEVYRLRTTVENQIPSKTNQLAKFNFTGKIEGLCKKFQHGTRKWFFDKLSSWFDNEQSRVMILTAGPGVGKSVLSAKACEWYKQREQLAACHFCDFKNTDSRNPHRILQSLASQMCDNIEGFRDELTEVLHREHSRDSLPDAFRVLLNDPLHALARHEPVLMVVDALDESKTDVKSDFLELISEEFSELPQWVKILITSRPELQVSKQLEHFNPVEIRPDDRHHTRDLEHFVQQCLPNLNEGNVDRLVSKCEGSFLYAYYIVNELQKRDLGIEPNLNEFVPKGISGFYEKQFKRLQTGLLNVNPDTGLSVFQNFLNVVVASKDPLPIKILYIAIGLSNEEYKVRETIINIMSEILPLYDSCITVYHKSLWDWLTLNGYEEHAFKADVEDGVKRLWLACKSIYIDIESLASVSHFSLTPERMFALQNGEKYLLDVGDAEDFRWLVHIRLNFLKLKNLNSLNVDISRILRFYKSKRPNLHYWNIIHLESFSKAIQNLRFDLMERFSFKSENEKLLIYLQSLANGYFDFMQRSNDGKNEARDILEESKQMWIEEIGNDYTPQNKVISSVILGQYNGMLWFYDGMVLSSDNTLLGYKNERYFEVFNLPCLKLLFVLEVNDLRGNSRFLLFSPDSSYLLWNSIRSCISLRERKVVPFIPLGPDNILCCSFSTCGMKLVTFETNLVKVWDLEEKNILIQVESEVNVEHCLWTDCSLYILARPERQMKAFDFCDIAILSGTSLERLDSDRIICSGSCLNDEDDYQIISPSRHDLFSYSTKFHICHVHLPNGGICLIANRFCSKPFGWKDRKCVIYIISHTLTVVYDYINQEVVELFVINCLPGNCSVDRITYLEGTNFFVGLDPYAFVLSLETSIGSSSDRFESDDSCDIRCHALSPDNLYVACCYENRILSIQRVDDGRLSQVIILERPPEACWWSQMFLWVACEDVVVKYPYDSAKAEILGNACEDCSFNFNYVLKFMYDVLVVCLVDNETAIFKICNQKLCRQQIPDSTFPASSVAISRDGCAVLLCTDSDKNYQFWEIGCENKWELCTTGTLHFSVSWFSLIGEKNSRSLICMQRDITEDLCVFSIDFPARTEGFRYDELSDRNAGVEGIYLCSNMIIIHEFSWIRFVDLTTGNIITSLYARDFYFPRIRACLYIPSQRMLLFIGLRAVKFLRIHNIENYLACLPENQLRPFSKTSYNND